MRKLSFALALITLAAFPGCKKLTQAISQNKLVCSATALESTVDALEAVTIRVEASGGQAPYRLLGQIGTFDSTIEISRSYANASSAEITVDDTVIVNDNIGFLSQCSFSLTVRPEPAQPPAPAVTLVANPSATVAVGSAITVVAGATGLGTSPSFSFDYSESGVAMAQLGHQAIFTVTDGQAHEFDVTVEGSGNGETAEKTLTLKFTTSAPGSMACLITHDKGTAAVNESIKFTLTALSGEALEVTEFLPGVSGAVQAVNNGVVDVKYSSIGIKSISAKAKGKVTGKLCNAGAALTDSVTITAGSTSTLACTASADESEYRVFYGFNYPEYWPQTNGLYNSAIVTAAVTGAVGSAQVTGVETVSTSLQGGWLDTVNPLVKEVFFYQAGYTSVKLTVRDQAGKVATCQTPTLSVFALQY